MTRAVDKKLTHNRPSCSDVLFARLRVCVVAHVHGDHVDLMSHTLIAGEVLLHSALERRSRFNVLKHSYSKTELYLTVRLAKLR